MKWQPLLRKSALTCVLSFALIDPRAEAALEQAAPCGAWEGIPVEQAGTDPVLWGIDGSAPDDIWAVGAYYSPLGHAQLQHWDGTRWSLVPDGGSALPVSVLRSVSVVAANDVWVVGLYNGTADGTGPIQPLAEHWDGQAWTVVPTPEAGVNASLVDVAATATDDVWAVGSYSTPAGESKALILHWDGNAWTTSAPAEIPWNHGHDAVAVVASDDVWAVGRVQQEGRWTTLVQHWDGAQWSVVPSGGEGGILNGITVVNANDIWAVGTSTTPNTVLTLHWDGSTWSTVPNGLAAITLEDATASGPADVWAVGTGADLNPIAAHWNGTSWSTVPTVSGFTLYSVESFGPDLVWSVGQTRSEALAARYTNACQQQGAHP